MFNKIVKKKVCRINFHALYTSYYDYAVFLYMNEIQRKYKIEFSFVNNPKRKVKFTFTPIVLEGVEIDSYHHPYRNLWSPNTYRHDRACRVNHHNCLLLAL